MGSLHSFPAYRHRVERITRDGRRKVRHVATFGASPRVVEPTGPTTYRDPRTGMEYDIVWNGGPLLDPRSSRPLRDAAGVLAGHRHTRGDSRW